MEFNATFIVAFVSFIIFTFVMNSILYKPICDIVTKRKKMVDSNYDEANKNIDKKVAILLERDEKLKDAVNQAKELLAQKTLEITHKRDLITENARNDAQKNIDDYNKYYEKAASQAKEILQNETVVLAQLISDKILGSHEAISENEFEKLIKG